MCVFQKERKIEKVARTIWHTHTNTHTRIQTHRIVFGVKENVHQHQHFPKVREKEIEETANAQA